MSTMVLSRSQSYPSGWLRDFPYLIKENCDERERARERERKREREKERKKEKNTEM